MSFIDRTLRGIKLLDSRKSIIWQEISDALGKFYSNYSSIETGIWKDNKKEFEDKRNETVQKIWDELTERIDGENLKLAFYTNYKGVTDSLIDGYMEGVKLIQSMYCEKIIKQKKINGKNTKITFYKWDNNLLSKYEIRNDKKHS